MLSVEAARARTLELLPVLPDESCPVHDAVGRALCVDVVAQRTLPPWDNSAMDGYAVRSVDVATTPARLRVVEAIFAGSRPTKKVGPGECSRIMTGAPLPEGADAVVMQEKTRSEPGSAEVEILEPVTAHAAVRDRGEDARAGELLLPKGTVLGIPEAGLLWAQGMTHVKVPRRPRVAILSTGDELCTVEEAGEDRIVDTNSPSLALAVARAGGVPSLLGIARDTPEDVLEKLEAAAQHDVVLTSAGVSVGEKDFVKEALARMGVAMGFWRVAIKPGKPLAVGRRRDTLFFGLPGNPTSSLVSFELFVRPALRRMLGHADVEPTRVSGRVEVPLKKKPGLAHYLRAIARWKNGQLWARPLGSQTSGALRSAASATHLLCFPEAQAELASGDAVELLPLSWTG
jgi:molybdopterin molybdotransferase